LSGPSSDDGRPAAARREADAKLVGGGHRLRGMAVVARVFHGVHAVGKDAGLVGSAAQERQT